MARVNQMMDTFGPLAELIFRIQTVRKVQKHGWTAQAVQPTLTHRPYCYTIGFSAKDKPDFVLVGLPPYMALEFFTKLFRAEDALEEGTLHRVAANFKVKISSLPESMEECLSYSRSFHEQYHSDKPFRAMQLHWPDLRGRFPGEEDFDPNCSQLASRFELNK